MSHACVYGMAKAEKAAQDLQMLLSSIFLPKSDILACILYVQSLDQEELTLPASMLPVTV
jgi:hypothetical protein